MKIKITFSYLIAFAALTFFLVVQHEIAHTNIGRFICGCWGKRDFNVWELCGDCFETNKLAILATIAGPVLSYLIMYLGVYFIKKEKLKFKSLGFSLIFANLPFGRLLSAILNSGDELMIIKYLGASNNWAQLITIILILTIIYYPLVSAYKIISEKRRVLLFLSFLILPLLLVITVILIVLNYMLQQGFLNTDWIIGSPVLVTIWTLFVSIILIIYRKHIYTLFKI